MNIYQRSPKTEQFMTAKLFDNALKQGVEHIQCDVSAVLNCKNSSRSKGMWLVGGHPGLTAV